MEEKQVKKSGAKVALAVCVGLIAGVLLAYLGLCGWASGHLLPNSQAAGISLGGLSHEAATQQMKWAAQAWNGKTVDLIFEDTTIACELDKADVAFDSRKVIDQLSGGPFLLRGAAWFRALMTHQPPQATNVLVFENRPYIDAQLADLNVALTQPMVQHAIQIGESEIQIIRGQDGQSLEAAALEQQLLTQLEKDRNCASFTPQPIITQPEAIDFQQLYNTVYVEPVDAVLGTETFAITPSVTGVSFDMATARLRFEAAKPGECAVIPLQFTQPEFTTEMLEALLFSDVLGQVDTYVSGVNARVANVRLAGQLCHNTILMPGEEFSYWDKVAPCSREQGFQPAPSYVKGETVDSVGGGMCQVSSSIYYAALQGNLEIVQRRNHTYAVGYVPDGADATVFSGGIDFRFKNNTAYPIKIVVKMENRSLSVQILGTKSDDTYVKMQFVELSRNPHETIYQIDDTVPAGTTREKVSGYTGRKVEAYRCIYAGDGTLLSKTLESVSNYQRRDRIIQINSADAMAYGIDPATGEKLPEVPPAPQPEVPPTPQPDPGVEQPVVPQPEPGAEQPVVPEDVPVAE